MLLVLALPASGCGWLGVGTGDRDFTASLARRPDPPAAPAPPRDAKGARILGEASRVKGSRILVSIQDRWLWLLEGGDTLVSGPITVGKGQVFHFRGKTYRFETPRGRRRVVAKEPNPVWTVPDWHYYEKAVAARLQPVHLGPDDRVELSDGTTLEVRGEQVGRINHSGNWWPWTPGKEIIFDGKIFVPPMHSAQRRVPNALGAYKLDMGDGYLIHGTPDEATIGRAVSHGCIRMRDDDLARLYELAEVGTPVFIY
ncbi:MAG: L,D-transpeptidase [Gemmatimonadetes bacterium]|nr:L,D-transpeptidase [Gemmatimonadota bacterium]